MEIINQVIRKNIHTILNNHSQKIYNLIINKNYINIVQCKKDDTHLKSSLHENEITKCFVMNHFHELGILKKSNNYWLVKDQQKFRFDKIKKAIEMKEYKMENKDYCENNKKIQHKLPIGLYLVQQIRGSHNHPDITLLNIDENYIYLFLIECKSGNGKIMWNDNFPGDKYYSYIFTDLKYKNTVIFPGGHETVICDEVKNNFTEYKSKIDLQRKNKEMLTIPMNIHHWDIYPRYNYVSSYNFARVSDEIKNIWKQEFIKKYNLFISKQL